jgi:hypothetical protein
MMSWTTFLNFKRKRSLQMVPQIDVNTWACLFRQFFLPCKASRNLDVTDPLSHFTQSQRFYPFYSLLNKGCCSSPWHPLNVYNSTFFHVREIPSSRKFSSPPKNGTDMPKSKDYSKLKRQFFESIQ